MGYVLTFPARISAMKTIQSHPWLTFVGLLFCLWDLRKGPEEHCVRKPNLNRLRPPLCLKGLLMLGAMPEVPSMSDKPWLGRTFNHLFPQTTTAERHHAALLLSAPSLADSSLRGLSEGTATCVALGHVAASEYEINIEPFRS